MAITVALLANPRAGRGRGARLAGPVREALAAAGLDVLVLAGESGRESVELATDAVARDVGGVVAVGGDGLVHCAVQALGGTAVPLGIVPAGGGNDLAGALGLPLDPVAAVGVIARGRTRTIDLGRTDRGIWWAGVLNAGFDSAVVARAERSRIRGPLRYDIATWLELARLRPTRMRITLDGEASEQDVTLVAVGNSSRYGGGMHIAPAAVLDDGLLHVTIADAMTRRHLARLKPLVRAGLHVRDPLVTVRTAREVILEAPGVPAYGDGELDHRRRQQPGTTVVPAYADGEPIGPLPVTARCVPAALQVYVP